MITRIPVRCASNSRRMQARGGLLRFASAAVLLACAAACSGSSGSEVVEPPSNSPTANGLGSYFLPTSHQGGSSNDLSITGLQWGRLVDVFESTGDPQNPIALVFEDLLIDHSITESTLEYDFLANPVSGKEFVVVGYPRDSGEFLGVVTELGDTQPVPPKGVGPNVLPPFTAVSRNAAIAIHFNDLIDADTVTAQNVLVMAGDPPNPTAPFEARIVPSTTHGALVGGTFHSTRVIVDFTISTLDALDDPDLEVNALGLPPAQHINAPNAVLRIPTKTGSGQFTLLTNLSGHGLNFASAGPSDPSSPTLDVVRSFRSQGTTEATGDVNNGFLPDGIPPSVLGTQGVFAQQNVPGDPALMDVTFLTPACSMPLRVGDTLEFSGFIFQVVSPGQLAGNIVVNTRVVALSGDLDDFGPSFGLFKTTWDPALGAPPECFVRFDPQPGTSPATDVLTTSTVIAEFSEPMDPSQMQALETFRVRYDEPPVADNPMYANVVGRILPSADLRSFVFEPSLPLRHTSGASETYFVEITADDATTSVVEGITDLAGNPLVFGLPSAPFSIDPAEASQSTGGYALRFADPLGDEDDNGKPDIRGQYVIDPRQVVKPRPFQRFSVLIDNNQPLVGIMSLSPGPVQTPLSDKGSRTQTVWRYIDMGFGLLDDLFHNLDVEGTNWAVYGSAVASDSFEQFSMRMTHASVFPDETVTPGLLPFYLESGLGSTFADNLLDPSNVQQKIMADKAEGYSISASDAFPAAQNAQVLLVPWPINRDVSQEDFTYWTWRDTGVIQVGGAASGSGVDPTRLGQVTGVPGLVGFYGPTQIPTIGLPMLTEFRTYPDPGAFGLNGFKTSFALASSYKPCFRAYSTGGIPAGQPPDIIDPDNEPLAQGGYTPAGAKLGGIDNTVYWGQADFVVRVSRFHSVWYDSTQAGSHYAPVVVEPTGTENPTGTTVAVAFRGASALSVTGGASTPPEWSDASNIDPYGDPYNQDQLDELTQTTGSFKPFTVVHYPTSTNKSWKDSASELNGARYLQMRVTMTANPASGLTPEVAAMGVAYINP
jgi:hypothetical protein